MANNFGVLLDDLGRNGDAFEMYKMARELDEGNISALLNISAMVSSGRASDADGAIGKAVKELDKNLSKKDHIWTLSHYYGYVRTPEAFSALGWKWAYTGQTGMAISEIERAEKMLDGEGREKMQTLKASLFMRDNREEDSARIYEDVLAREPENLAALRGMLDISMMRGDIDKATEYLKRAAAAGMPKKYADLQRAAIAFASGKIEESQNILEDLLLSEGKLLKGWVLLSDIAFTNKDRRLLDKSLRRIESIEGDRGYYGSCLRAKRALQEKDYKSAVEYYEAALNKKPSAYLHGKLLRLEMILGRPEEAQEHIKALLLADPDNAMALYMRGNMQLSKGNLKLAEDSLRHSLKTSRSALTLNDLASLLERKGEYAEAEKLINEALEKLKSHPALWDTKGEIMLALKRYKDAEEAFGQSLAIFDKSPEVQLHMAEAQLGLGNKVMVKEIVDRVGAKRESLSSDCREILGQLQLELGKSESGN
jgi:tetratricopeptide (TPR) repeat protein